MSIIASNCIQICNSPTNTSKSKMLFSFPKANRFIQQRKTMCHTFYDSENNWSRRSTNFGYGKKYDFTKTAPASPPPNTYQITSQFKKSNSKKGFGFGCGRAEMQITGPLVQTIKNKNPGPGSYHLRNSELDKTSYSLGKRLIQQDPWKKIIPGPGKYEAINTINQKGSYFLSKYKNSKCPSISLLKRKDMNVSTNPGPGRYQAYDNMSPEGKYVSSKHNSSFCRPFPKENRASLVPKLKTPGPGFYRLPSEFGYYQSSKIKQESAKQNTAN